jgi:hypothetical protein
MYSYFKKQHGAHKFVSMRQFYRYLFQIRGDWINYHWLWWALWMAQIYVLTIYNRIEANEASAIKNAQANLKTILPAVLIQAVQNKINNGDLLLPNYFNLNAFVRSLWHRNRSKTWQNFLRPRNFSWFPSLLSKGLR